MIRVSRRQVIAILMAFSMAFFASRFSYAATAGGGTMVPTEYKSAQVKGLKIFYRDAGPMDAPVILLLHGFPSSSRMYAGLMNSLSDRYHVIAPDYPGFGHSDAPPPTEFAYTFDHLAETMDEFTEMMGLNSYTLFMQDYGAPVGMRMAVKHPERIKSIIIQNGNLYEEGLGPAWEVRRAFWRDRTANETALRANFLSLETTRKRHLGSDPNPELYDPDSWTDEFTFLSKPGQSDIQVELFYDYQSNVKHYPEWQAWLREHQPPALILWGRYDPSFTQAGGEAFRKDLPKCRFHLLDAGHFAMDTRLAQVTGLVSEFMK